MRSRSAAPIFERQRRENARRGTGFGAGGHVAVAVRNHGRVFLREPKLHEEAFGPAGVVVQCSNPEEAIACVESLGGNLTGTVHIGCE